MIKTESALKYNNLKKRSDILIMNRKMGNFMVVECKSYKVKLKKSHLNQIAIYNKVYNSKYIMISNGMDHFICKYNWNSESFEFIDSIPKYEN